MNCEDVPMSEWDKLTGAEQEILEIAFGDRVRAAAAIMLDMDMNGVGIA